MKLGGRQLAIMNILWERGEATVADVQAALDVERDLAYSTVATVLSRMEKKGLVTHRVEDRVYFYQPAVTRDGAGKSMIGDVIARVFGGSPAELVNHLLESESIDSSELQRIKELLRKHEAEQKRGDSR
ncbi:BlaI/MecI/CopY family transcriptional regulator [Blastopirellula sp. JC732]|uniref:BlaI/MecI/CopY family transcriptional regulator n=1 Tax=Blastopirellula sediminis TaxID=2894196 RepID=A0A9X1ML65_9BACT|nr:BlaI/MecI/CopY family transcriptional regulator [Blastopirellula sediminis]MCC9608602.1 BlaI/MecI/CopY family transcriptional regulator [Blastopirellula sediminis]MCC9628621.1 BlaI/MecI/CopY family transcriptional regulator [Blastopirellula sediminis]